MAGARQRRERGDVDVLQLLDGLEVAQLELRHPAARFLLDDGVRHLVVREDREQVVADSRLVVVDVAGREDRHLPRRAHAVAHRPRDGRLGRLAESRAVVRRQPGLGRDAEHLVHQLPRRGRRTGLVDHLHDDRNRRETADAVGAGQQPVAEFRSPLPEFDRLRAKHQVGKIEVPRVRRHVRALRHVADVAQVALVDDLRVVLLGHAVHFHRLGTVDEVEQRRERLAQADAPPAAVTDVEDALQFLLERRFVVESGIAPVERVPGGCLQVAFALGHWIVQVPWICERSRAARRPGLARRPAAATAASASPVRDALTGRRASRLRRRSNERPALSPPVRRAPSGNDSRASVRPSPAFRTSRRSRRNPRRARTWPCPGTCRCTRASRPRSPP